MQIHWKKLTLGDLGQIITGKTPSTQNSLFWDGNIPFITPKDIQSSKHILTTERYLSQDGAHAVKSSILPKDSICVSCIGNIGYIGKTTKLSVSNQQINSIIPNQYNDSDFIYYLMKSLWVYFKNYEGQSTALSILNKSQFSNIEISIPPLDVQKKIAGVLGALDDKIELNNKINQNLEAQAQALFKSWFIDFEPFGGKMPDDWKIGKLSDIAEYSNDTISTEFTSFENYISTENMLPNRGGISRASSLPTSNTVKSYRTTDVLISNIRPYFKKIWFALFSGGCSNDILVFRSKKDSPAFVFNVLNQDDFFEYVMSGANGSKMPRGDKKHIMQYKVIIPSAKTIKEFENIAITFLEKFSNNNQENLRLAELRDTLLPKLMNGEIDVDNVKID